MWAIKHISENRLNGYREYLEGAASVDKPAELAGYNVKVFATRKAAREYIQKQYAYIRTRRDLRSEPHGWRMPQAVRVNVTVEEALNLKYGR